MQGKNNRNHFSNNNASTNCNLHENSAKIVSGFSASEAIFLILTDISKFFSIL